MKKGILMLIAVMMPLAAMATAPIVPQISVPAIPSAFHSSSQTSTFEWGCPVSEVVQAKTSSDAVTRIGKECMEEARRAASEKPGVFEVIKVSVIVPDVNVTKQAEGYMLTGTFFLETLVLKGME